MASIWWSSSSPSLAPSAAGAPCHDAGAGTVLASLRHDAGTAGAEPPAVL
ncbi:hypothetical protein [Pseudoduganella lurida]|nr:hypothetical protein [Pseudoduganella lurida]